MAIFLLFYITHIIYLHWKNLAKLVCLVIYCITQNYFNYEKEKIINWSNYVTFAYNCFL